MELFTSQEILDAMDKDMEESGVPQGEIVSCLYHWRNKYYIVKREDAQTKDGYKAELIQSVEDRMEYLKTQETKLFDKQYLYHFTDPLRNYYREESNKFDARRRELEELLACIKGVENSVYKTH